MKYSSVSDPISAADVRYKVDMSESNAFVLIEGTLGPEAEFLDVIGTKVLRIFLLTIHSNLYSQIAKWFGTCLECKHCIMETSSLRTIKIMPRNLNVHEFGFRVNLPERVTCNLDGHQPQHF